ncbi:MAG: 23S rRNA (guanosine(2251)-2'-O)-methyltransferase RlmB [Anaerolineaceae bacterium]|nr:23S rRNA (guanosine(2251)-2'-O)-methyltransferase RlmB [Anaerolineaceae bacterium]
MKEWITGRNPVYETLRAKRRQPFRLLLAQGVQEKGRLAEVIELANASKVPIERVPRQHIDSLGENPQGVALEASGYPYSGLEDILERADQRSEPLFVLVLDTLQNPQNLGSLLRTAEAAGMHGVVLPLARTVGVTPAVVVASAGASEHQLIAQANLAQAMKILKESGAWVVGLENTSKAQPPDRVRLDGPLAIVVGSEGEGMRPLVRQSCDFLLALPMHGQVESLNAAVAGSIAIYLALLQRGEVSQAED